MPTQTDSSAEAPANALAMMIAANGRIDERELHALDELDAFRRLGVSRDRFIELARDCLRDVGAGLCERSWLRDTDVLYFDRLLDEVRDPTLRLLVCRLAAAAITADGQVTPDEKRVYGHALARWHVSQAMVTQSILSDRTH